MSTESNAKEVAIQRIMATWQVSLKSDAEYDAYLSVLGDCSAASVAHAAKMLCEGRVERNHAFVPKPPEVARIAREWDETIAAFETRRLTGGTFDVVSYKIGEKPPPGMVSLGEYDEKREKHLAQLARERQAKLEKKS